MFLGADVPFVHVAVVTIYTMQVALNQYYLALLAISFPPTLQAHISTLESMVWIVLAANYNWHTFMPMFHQFFTHQSGYLILVYEYILLVVYFCHIVSTLNLYKTTFLHMYCTDTVTKECSLIFLLLVFVRFRYTFNKHGKLFVRDAEEPYLKTD